jgi:hypothetical protein
MSEWPSANKTVGMPASAPSTMGRKSTRATHSAHSNGNGTPRDGERDEDDHASDQRRQEVAERVAGRRLGDLARARV